MKCVRHYNITSNITSSARSGKYTARKTSLTDSLVTSTCQSCPTIIIFHVVPVPCRIIVERTRTIDNGNTKRRFHGTIRACRLGDSDTCRDLCEDSDCSLCSIIQVRTRGTTKPGRLIIDLCMVSLLSNWLRLGRDSISVDLDLEYIHLQLRLRYGPIDSLLFQ